MMDQTIIDCADHGELDREDDRSIHAYLESDDKTCPTCGTDLAEIERGEPTWPLLAVADHVRECAESKKVRR